MTSEKKVELQRQPCEIFSRIVGYYRPVNNWNDAQQSQYVNRKKFIIK